MWSTNKSSTLPFVLGGLILIYLLLRAVVVPITVDEYLTLRYFVEHDWISVLTSWHPDITHASNNHVLNSILFKLSIAIFGEHDWAIRLHVLAAFIVSFYFVWKILLMFTPSAARLTFYLGVIFLNPYLLDFFAIARGYALSIAGWSAATYFFILYLQKADIRYLRNTLIWLFVAFYANFSAIYFSLLFGAGITIKLYQNRAMVDLRKHILLFLSSILIIAMIIGLPLYRTITSHTTHGGSNSFFQDVVVSYVGCYIHYNHFIGRSHTVLLDWKYKEIYAVVLIVVWIITNGYSVKLIQEKGMQIAHYSLIYQCIGIILLCCLFFELFHTPYPLNRTTLLFSFPFILSFVVALEAIVKKYASLNYAFVLIAISILWHFMICCNLDNTYEWKSEGDGKRVLSYLKTKQEEVNTYKIPTIGVENWRYPSMAFYGRTTYKDIVKIEWIDVNQKVAFDYLYVPYDLQDELLSEYGIEKNFKHGVLLRRLVKASQ